LKLEISYYRVMISLKVLNPKALQGCFFFGPFLSFESTLLRSTTLSWNEGTFHIQKKDFCTYS
jgi:hypothetical protein